MSGVRPVTAGQPAAEDPPAWYDEVPAEDDGFDGGLGFDGCEDDEDQDEFDGSAFLDHYVEDTAVGLQSVAPGELEVGDVFVLDLDPAEEVIQVLAAPLERDGGWVVQVAAGRRRRVIGQVAFPARAWAWRLWHNRLRAEPFAGLGVAGGQDELAEFAASGTVSYRMVPLATAAGVVDVVDVAVDLTDLPSRQLQEHLAAAPLTLVAWCGGTRPASVWFSGWQRLAFQLTGPAVVDGRAFSWRATDELSRVVSVIGPLAEPPPFLSTAAAERTHHPDKEA